MADEVIKWMDSNCFEKVFLLGHSLGGKVAMVLASNYPERIERLIVADIIPPSILLIPWLLSRRC